MPAKFNLASLMPAPTINTPKPPSSSADKLKYRARLIAHEWLRNGQNMTAAYRSVTGYKVTGRNEGTRLLRGQEDVFLDEIKIRYEESAIDKVQVLNFLWEIFQASILDFFDEHGQLLSVPEMKKLPRVLQRLISEMEVNTSQSPILVNGQPMLDDNGAPYLTTKSFVKIKMPEKLSAISTLASIMKWTGPQVVINDNRTLNVSTHMAAGDDRQRRLEASYATPVDAEFKDVTDGL
jgi:hypothetical protein